MEEAGERGIKREDNMARLLEIDHRPFKNSGDS